MLKLRIATEADIGEISALMRLSIERLQRGFLTPEQIAASWAGMGLDRQLIEDGTYFCVFDGDELAGCGGWSRRATHYGGDHSAGRDPRLLDPQTERARIRAMYTHPEHTRKGVGRLILQAGEEAAKVEGFSATELSATMAGKPFYLACGYTVENEFLDRGGKVPVPLALMAKPL